MFIFTLQLKSINFSREYLNLDRQDPNEKTEDYPLSITEKTRMLMVKTMNRPKETPELTLPIHRKSLSFLKPLSFTDVNGC